jgi:hypothetical protein
MPKHWTAEERVTLKGLVGNGVAISTIMGSLSRSEGAIMRESLDLGYGTKEVNGVKVLNHNLQRRDRSATAGKNKATSNSLKPAITDVLIDNVSSISNFSLTVMEANNKIVDMLKNNDLVVTPEIIFTLTTHIINTQGINNGN